MSSFGKVSRSKFPVVICRVPQSPHNRRGARCGARRHSARCSQPYRPAQGSARCEVVVDDDVPSSSMTGIEAYASHDPNSGSPRTPKLLRSVFARMFVLGAPLTHRPRQSGVSPTCSINHAESISDWIYSKCAHSNDIGEGHRQSLWAQNFSRRLIANPDDII